MPKGVYTRHKEMKRGIKPQDWERTFRKAIKQAEEAGEIKQAKKIQMRFNAAQRDMVIMEKTKKRGVASHRIASKLGTQHRNMVQRLITEVDMFMATDVEATPENKPNEKETVNKRNARLADDKQKLGLIKEIITVVKALKDLKTEHDDGKAETKAELEEADETKSAIADATVMLKKMGLSTRLN